MTGARILVIDDERQIHRFLRPALEAEGYVVDRADTGAEGVKLTALRPASAILLDLGLPDADGQAVLRKLRALTHAPILVISARDGNDDKVEALDGGADDYIPKPFAIPELLARIRACLRRALVAEGVVAPWKNDGLCVDLLHRSVQLDGEELQLTPREYELLAALVRHAGRTVTHGQLLRLVWGAEATENVQYLRVYVGHLRQKLGRAGAAIRTETGIGYKIVEGVRKDPPGA